MEGYVGEIRALPYNFIPDNWLVCAGQALDITQYDVLYYVIGDQFGRSSEKTFCLPNLSSRVAVSAGQRSGSEKYVMGQYGGSNASNLYSSNLPEHRHQVVGANIKGVFDKLVNTPVADTCYLSNALDKTNSQLVHAYGNEANCTMSFDSISTEGKSVPHDNMMPYTTFCYCICWSGLLAPRA